ncbi:hypothetical protein AOQ84DRAFT_363745 [Glonium stellatum]|uniref:Uncharacterized protein n=1 Tax=Glonium stellatum TaxID=574774 RepID=A0A8E2F2D4_9PEZI|nr:hypothetical protein AOQ84DRAFT_363745 [Glonium stellatum]
MLAREGSSLRVEDFIYVGASNKGKGSRINCQVSGAMLGLLSGGGVLCWRGCYVAGGWSERKSCNKTLRVQETTSNQERKMVNQRLKRWTAGKNAGTRGHGGGQSRKQRASEVIPLVPGSVGTCIATIGIKAHHSSHGGGGRFTPEYCYSQPVDYFIET